MLYLLRFVLSSPKYVINILLHIVYNYVLLAICLKECRSILYLVFCYNNTNIYINTCYNALNSLIISSY